MDTHQDANSPQPATFAERGVAVPFTAPGLAGSRVRMGKAGLELVFANPSGARGTYVVPWAGVPGICQPTVHDVRLLSALAAGAPPAGATRDVIGPARVQQAARRVALDGAAGRPARAAAQAAAAADQARTGAATRHLLSDLIAQGGNPDLQEAAALAAVVAELGVGPSAADAPVPQAIAATESLRDGLLAWAARNPGDAAPARLLAALAAAAAAGAAAALAAAHHPTTLELLLAWRSAPERVAALAARPAWLLDGWRLPGLIWSDAAPGSSAALAEAAHLASFPPREAEAWTGLPTDPAAPGLLRRILAARAGEARAGSARTGGGGPPNLRGRAITADLVARNERLRALAA